MWNASTGNTTILAIGGTIKTPKGLAIDPGGTVVFIANSVGGTISRVIFVLSYAQPFF